MYQTATEESASALRLVSENRTFWDEACGTVLAEQMGLPDLTPASLRRFDEAYFDLYPFLLRYLPEQSSRRDRVLEIGLGYGSLSQAMMSRDAEYLGLDIAVGPAGITNLRAGILGKPPCALVADARNLPFETGSFDHVISIGCLHHTGDIARAVREVHRVLRPGGRAVVMIYNALCYKNWILAPMETIRTLLRRQRASGSTGSLRLRRAHDRNLAGEPPPETAFHKASDVPELFSDFSAVRTIKENCYLRLPPSFQKTREFALRTLGRWCGLNLYITARK